MNKLDFGNNNLSGTIPLSIFELYNLGTNYGRLRLNDNEFSGMIPESICDLELNEYNFSIYNNQICPPYPECIQNYIGEQNTLNCP